jgi:prophage regulatory protein
LKRNILRRAAVLQRTGLSLATLWRYERDGKFPQRFAIDDAGRMVGWYEDEVDQWVHDRVRGGGARPKNAPALTEARAKAREREKALNSGAANDAAD